LIVDVSEGGWVPRAVIWMIQGKLTCHDHSPSFLRKPKPAR